MRCSSMILALAGLAPAAAATDLLVGPGGYPTLSQAMNAAVPGDRLLVLPGRYPPFQLSKGVAVVGLGSDPSAVVIGRMDVFVSVPSQHYDASVSNVTLGDNAASDLIAISGNEQPPGTVVISGSRIEGGVFLGGGANGFHAHFQNCGIDAGPGEGFLGAAVHLGGTAGFSAEFTDCTITAWDAQPSAGVAAGVGLRLAGPMHARLTNTVVRGGDGAGALPAGGDGIAAFAPLGAAWLRLQGHSFVFGGNAAPGGAGGDAIDLAGSMQLGSAFVQGGSGTPAGTAFHGVSPVALPMDPWLQATPASAGGEAPVTAKTGQPFGFSLDADGPTALLLALQLDVPPTGTLQPLGPVALTWIGNAFAAQVPDVGFDLPGVLVFAQAFTRPPGGGPLLDSNVQVLRLDLDTLPH